MSNDERKELLQLIGETKTLFELASSNRLTISESITGLLANNLKVIETKILRSMINE